MRMNILANSTGRPSQPTATLKDTVGAAHNGDRVRSRAGELQPPDDMDMKPPKELSKEEQLVWKEIVKRAAPGVLKGGDEFVVELAVRLIFEMREKRHSFNKASQLTSTLAHLGMTPAGRSMVKDPNYSSDKPKPPKSGFAALRARVTSN